MPDDELTSRFDGLRERLAPLVEEPPVGAIERRGRRRQRARRAGAALVVAAVAVGAWMLVMATGRGWPGGELDQGPVGPPPTVPAPAPTPTTAPEPTRTSREPAPSSTRPPTTTTPPTTTVRGLRILEPRAGTVVHPGQRVRMRAVGCPPGGQVWFEDGTALRAGQDGSFTTSFEIPPGPTGDFFLDATCGGATREVKLRREP